MRSSKRFLLSCIPCVSHQPRRIDDLALCGGDILTAILTHMALVFLSATAAFRAPHLSAAVALRSPAPHRHRHDVRLCEELDAAEISGLYASLQKRRSLLASRRDKAVKERELIAAMASKMPGVASPSRLWQHWFGEEGESAGEELMAADGDATALKKLIDEYPDWAEPANRLATLRYMEGDYEDSVQLCLQVLREKPWHFGAGSGIVMCYAKLAELANATRRDALVAEANKWAAKAMPPPGPRREEWVKRMLLVMDEKLDELKEISD